MNIAANHHLENKLIVITGAGGVLCAFLAKKLAHTKANLALLDINFEAADKVAQEINQAGGHAKAYKTNVLELENIKEVRNQIETDFGTCDILINGAGGNNPKATTDNEFHQFDLNETTKTFFDLDKSGIEFVFNLNYLGTLLPTQVFAKDMIGKKGANIINISSMNAFTEGKPTDRANKILTNTPMGRFGEPEELLGALLFLIDEHYSAFVNGVLSPVDGGFSAYSGVWGE